ncbi:MAG TPA: ABC transporter permease subunit [Spirochaetota bacterium]|nr:ABC transporter permease subunit [Spirochaetota bacterium]
MKKRKKILGILGLSTSYFLLILGSFFISIPFIWMLVTSLKDKGSIFTYPPEWIPRSVLTTVYKGKEKKIYYSTREDKNIDDLFVEISSRITEPKIQYTIVKKVVADPYVSCRCKIIKNVNRFQNTTCYLPMESLRKISRTYQHLGEVYDVYILQKKVRRYKPGLEVIVKQTNQQQYRVVGDRITLTNFYEDNYKQTVFNPATEEDSSLLDLRPADQNIVGSEKAVKIENTIYKGDTWRSTVKKVRDSEKLKAEIQYLSDFDRTELSGTTALIAYNEAELVETEQIAEDMEGESKTLYYLKDHPDKKFAIFKTEKLKWEVYGDPVSNVLKQTAIEKADKLPEDLVEEEEITYANAYYSLKKQKQNLSAADTRKLSRYKKGLAYERIEKIENEVDSILSKPTIYHTTNYFKNKKTVKFHWDNYYKAFFKALPPIENQAVPSGFSILKILLMIFGQIPSFVVYFINSLVVTISATILELMTSCLAAYAFARLRWKGRDAVFLAYLATMMIPYAVTMIPVFVVIKKLGWIDSYKALILPKAFNPMSVFMLRQFFLSIPTSLEESAALDGCSKFGILWRVILPLSKPALATLAIFKFQRVYNDFMWPLIVTNSDHMKVVQIGLQSFQGMHTTEWSLLMAATVIVVVPILIMFIINQKYVTKGIKLGSGIKG